MKIGMPRILLNANPYSLNDFKKCYGFLVMLLLKNYPTGNILLFLIITNIVDVEILTFQPYQQQNFLNPKLYYLLHLTCI